VERPRRLVHLARRRDANERAKIARGRG
jgi:hypothetical protein